MQSLLRSSPSEAAKNSLHSLLLNLVKKKTPLFFPLDLLLLKKKKKKKTGSWPRSPRANGPPSRASSELEAAAAVTCRCCRTASRCRRRRSRSSPPL